MCSTSADNTMKNEEFSKEKEFFLFLFFLSLVDRGRANEILVQCQGWLTDFIVNVNENENEN